MRRLSGAFAVLIAVLALVSACGQQHVGSGGPLAGKSPGSNRPPVASCGGAQATASNGNKIDIHVSDNGKTLCVRQGTGVLVTLKGTPAGKWAPIKATSPVLAPRPNGALSLPLGVTGAYFVAVHPGTSAITSSRPVCGQSSSASPGRIMSCDALLAYHVTMKVVK